MPATPLSERWARTLRDHADQTAVVTPSGQTTFGELDALGRAAASRIPEDVPSTLVQGTLVPLLTGLIASIHRRTPAHLYERDRHPVEPAIPPPPGTALIKHTVGAAGIRRAGFFTDSQVLADVDQLHTALDLPSRGTGIVAISCAHSYGLSVLPLQLLFHALPLHEVASPFPAHVAAALADTPKAFLPAVPALWRNWIQSGIGLSAITLALTAGSPLPPSLAALRRFHDLYGTSETGSIALDGTLLPGVSAGVCASTGHLVVHSPAVAQAFDQPLPAELHIPGRTHRTTDRVALEGNRILSLHAEGAAANIAGRKVSPAEVLGLLRGALPPAWSRSVSLRILPSRDPDRHHELAAVLPGATPLELKQARKLASPHLASWQKPRHWLAG